MDTKIFGLLLLFFLMVPMISSANAQGNGFLPNHLEPITRENVQRVEQLAVIAPGGDDLTGRNVSRVCNNFA